MAWCIPMYPTCNAKYVYKTLCNAARQLGYACVLSPRVHCVSIGYSLANIRPVRGVGVSAVHPTGAKLELSESRDAQYFVSLVQVTLMRVTVRVRATVRLLAC
jgi:hypothetical protein